MNPERWKQVSQLFHAALARDAAERAAFLTGECAGDHEVRQIVESLISQESATGKFIDEPVFEMLAKPDPEGRANDPDKTSVETVNVGVQQAPGSTSPMEGRRLGAYRITREIGHGGMGSVYLSARADESSTRKWRSRSCAWDWHTPTSSAASIRNVKFSHRWIIRPLRESSMAG